MSIRSALCLSLVLALAGCDRVSRVRECRKLSGLVNPKLTSIEALAKKGSPAGYRAVAGNYGALARELRQSVFASSSVKMLAGEYAGMLDSVVPTVSSYATALEGQNARAQDDARHSLERLSRQEHTLVARIDAYCLAP